MRGSNTRTGRDLADRVMISSEGMLADARVLDNRHLFVVLGSEADMDTVPDLLRALLMVMHEAFPAITVTVHVQDQHRRPLVNATVDTTGERIRYNFP